MLDVKRAEEAWEKKLALKLVEYNITYPCPTAKADYYLPRLHLYRIIA
jgi:hypothetical protein